MTALLCRMIRSGKSKTAPLSETRSIYPIISSGEDADRRRSDIAGFVREKPKKDKLLPWKTAPFARNEQGWYRLKGGFIALPFPGGLGSCSGRALYVWCLSAVSSKSVPAPGFFQRRIAPSVREMRSLVREHIPFGRSFSCRLKTCDLTSCWPNWFQKRIQKIIINYIS